MATTDLAEESGGTPTQAGTMVAAAARALASRQGLRPTLAAISTAVRQIGGYTWVGFARVDRELGMFSYESFSSDLVSAVHVGYTLPLDSGVVGDAARRGEAVLVADVKRHPGYLPLIAATRSEAALPVMLDGEVVGVLNIESEHGTDFSDRIDDLASVAQLAAHVFRQDRAERRIAMLEDLHEIYADLSSIILSEIALDVVLQRVVDYLYERFSLTLCTLLLLEGQRTLQLKAYAGHSVVQLHRNRPWPAERGLIGRAFRERQSVFVADVREDPGYLEANRLTRATLAIPIHAGTELLGILALESAISESFSLDRRRMLEILTGHLAGAIRLAGTHERLLSSMSSLAERSADLDRANRALVRANARLRELSLVDALTGIGNRRAFEQLVRRAWADCTAECAPLSLLMIDVDHFKAFNDHYGHPEGDACLARIAAAIRATLRGRDDRVTRYGGEEFAVLLPATEADEAARCAARIHAGVAALGLRHVSPPSTGTVTLSIGAASVVPRPGQRPRRLIESADAMLLKAKSQGRNRTAQDA